MKRLRSSIKETPEKDEAEASTSHDALASSSMDISDSLEGRRCEQVSTLEEAKEVVDTSNHVLNVVVLPPTAGDSGSDDTDQEYLPDDPEDEFYPAEKRALPLWKNTEDLDRIFLVEQLQRNENLQQLASLTPLEGIHSVTPRNTAVHWSDTAVRLQLSTGSKILLVYAARHGCTGCHQLYEPQSFHGNKEVSPPGGQSEAGKPIRFGYKVWMLCGNDGYPYHMTIYQGKEIHAPKVPLSTRVIRSMVDIIQETSNTTRHTLYFDNFFNSYDLLVMLSELKMRAIGTIRPYRSNGAGAVMLPDKELMKQKRGAFDFRSDGNVYIAKWHDNSIVRIASNFMTHSPLRNTQRRVKGQRIEVKVPNIVRSYNTGMGGVDLLDKLAAAYRPTIRSKKWYWPLFINAVNVATVAAWRIHCFVEERPLSHLEFRRQVVLSLLQSEPAATPRAASGSMSQLPDIRFDGVNHILGTGPQGRCKVCKRNTKNMCKKCNVRLHAERGKQCFEIYHQQK
ncbi:PiggyBac transposable element-derived protein 3 [Trichinella sp. T6]|nr:PiggyBac transposable element-derived protein 3 [Trichinella sp. T6]